MDKAGEEYILKQFAQSRPVIVVSKSGKALLMEKFSQAIREGRIFHPGS